MRRSNRSFPFFARNWINNYPRNARRAGHTFSPRSSPDSHKQHIKCCLARAESIGTVRPPGRLPNALISIGFWLAVAASALPSGNSARSGAKVWDWNARRAFQRTESSETACPRKPLFDDCLGCLLERACGSGRFRTRRTALNVLFVASRT